ncbi:hypothetical protein HMPREF1579_01395 [Gardnerella vaginalis JCP8066]|nr:hypothetical protein HMPREF1579_01395 [Gardnerella vaginalis JCP8066]
MRIPPIRIILVCHNTCTEILERKYLSENAEVEILAQNHRSSKNVGCA